MVNILWYISSHGFGHTTRTIAIARDLLEKQRDLMVSFVVPKKSRTFLNRSLKDYKNRISLYELDCDIGLELKSFDEPSIFLMEKRLKEYIILSKKAIAKDSINFRKYDLIISDVVPHAFEVAQNLKIPSVLLSNFTWYNIYNGILTKDNGIKSLDNILDNMYSKADYSIQLATYSEKTYGKLFKADWYSREATINAEVIRKNILKFGYEKIVYIGMGMSTKIENSLIKLIENNKRYAFIVPTNFPKICSNMFIIPKDYYESQDYVAASDICIIKSGWSTVSECITMNKPTVVIRRENIPEDVNTQKFLKTNYGIENTPIEKIKNIDLKNITKPIKREYNDNVIIDILIKLINSNRSN